MQLLQIYGDWFNRNGQFMFGTESGAVVPRVLATSRVFKVPTDRMALNPESACACVLRERERERERGTVGSLVT